MYKKSKLSSAINLLEEEKCKTEDVVLALNSVEKGQRKTLNELEESITHANEEKIKLDGNLSVMNKKYDKLKLLIEQKNHSKTLRAKNPTSLEMISDSSNSTHYYRQNETRTMLQYIHGGSDGAIFGAWDFIQRFAPPELIEKLLINYKRGKFIESLHGKFSKTFRKSKEAMNQAIATKYQLHLSRRIHFFM